ncbi:hypothetical protein [Kitasatospora sp. SUK 42]|uniref:hypothetical protein n=1 Tax=Kitasatospora sp. SUK 42 TaxID=1588882 RepID=UPI0018C9D56E|nr:hypothetical protein [Kitasatospora sp. SUK 42]MBV2154341.1 hypothetical protein [Kitasatospora sp. SUK 42]
MPFSSVRPSAAALAALLLAVGCTTVGGPAGDRTAPGRELSADELRAAAVAEADLGTGYAVLSAASGRGGPGIGAGREAADVPACQPLLDVVAPAAPVDAPPGPGRPYAETDLSVVRAAGSRGGVHVALLGHRSGQAAVLQGELEGLLGPCASFTSVPAAEKPGEKSGEKPGRKVPVRTKHRLNREDTPTPEGADAVIGFTLTNESGTAVPAQRAELVRVGPALAVFTTVGVAPEPAPAPDVRVVRQQVAKLRAAQAASVRP